MRIILTMGFRSIIQDKGQWDGSVQMVGTYVMEGENQIPQIVLWFPHADHATYVPTHIHTKQIIIKLKNNRG